MGAKKGKRRKYKQSKMYGSERLITGKASVSHENVQIQNNKELRNQMALRHKMRRPVPFLESRRKQGMEE